MRVSSLEAVRLGFKKRYFKGFCELCRPAAERFSPSDYEKPSGTCQPARRPGGGLGSIPHRETIGWFFSFGLPRVGGVPLGDGMAVAVAAEGDLSPPLGCPGRGEPWQRRSAEWARLAGCTRAAAKELASDSKMNFRDKNGPASSFVSPILFLRVNGFLSLISQCKLFFFSLFPNANGFRSAYLPKQYRND